jgi:hypothetical protein
MIYHRFTRQEFYDLVWSQPLTHLAKRFGISDVALGKACRSAQIPHPPVGYWAKVEAGKNTVKADLPARGLGQSDVIEFGQDPYRRYHENDDELLAQPIPSPPTFSEDLEAVREQAVRLAEKAPIRRTMSNPHPLIAGLLAADEKRKEAIAKSEYGFAWDKPLFDTPLEKRRLKILNNLFLALAHCGCKPSIQGKEAKELYVRIGDVSLSFKLGTHAEVLEQSVGRQRAKIDTQERLTLKLSLWEKSTDLQHQWEDTDENKLEDQLEGIVVGMLVSGEWMYRAAKMHSYTYEMERRQKIEAAIRRKKEQADQAEQERVAKLRRDKRRQLVVEMLSWRRSNDLREYIVAALQKAHESGDAELIGKTEKWAAWANAEADEVDPLLRSAQQRNDLIAR